MKNEAEGIKRLLKKYEDAAAQHRKAADDLDKHAEVLRGTIASLEALKPKQQIYRQMDTKSPEVPG